MSLSAKEGGFIRVGSDQMKAAKIAEQNKLQKELARRPGEILDQEVDGMPSEKMAFVEEIAQIRLTKEGGSSIVTDKEKQLNETENTLKFAVFCLAFMSVFGLHNQCPCCQYFFRSCMLLFLMDLFASTGTFAQ